jgi:hypothetical protein
MTYVYLKTGKYNGTDLTTDTIPLLCTTIGVSVDKTIPSFQIPFSGAATGEAITAALDLGMSSKKLSIQGFITETTISKTRTASASSTETSSALTFTAHEIAQMIASGVDSTGLQDNQSFNEIVILIPSKIGNDYTARGSTVQIPLTFASRGEPGYGDNEGVLFRTSTFPDLSTATGLTGFIRSFSFNLEAEAIDISFSMEFEVAIVGP